MRTTHDQALHEALSAVARYLSDAIPPVHAADAVDSRNPAVEAMRQVIHLAEDRWDRFKRFQDMVQAAIEQFNTGSLARAATMFDLALGIGIKGKLDPDSVANIRKTSHESLDLNRLRAFVKETDKHPQLRKVLNFFEEFNIDGLLESLRQEERRERRRLFLDLLEIHGDAARRKVSQVFEEHLTTTNVATDWHFTRNLIFILNQIPRGADVPVKPEFEMIAPLLRFSLPSPLIREVIRYVGQTKCPESEALLVSAADRLEKAIAGSSSARSVSQKLALLDRTIFALAHYGTPGAFGKVVNHGLSREEKFGDAPARLAYLSSQDLSLDNESVALLLLSLRNNLPRKLLGVTIQKNEPLLLNIIKTLSSTPAPAVRQTMEEIAARFTNSKIGSAAASLVQAFEAAGRSGPAERMLSGDLALFALPDLLQQLNAMKATGVLTLKDEKGNPAGVLSLAAGCMLECTAGCLTGEEAAYQLLEKPLSGTFVFQERKQTADAGAPEMGRSRNLAEILFEGIRRYDELQRARAIVPDHARLRRGEAKEMPPIEEGDREIFDLIRQNASEGCSPEELESLCQTDSCRVRSLLARLVESGALALD